jgi:hypothetical protein
MINYVYINDRYWQKGKLQGIFNINQYIFEIDQRTENVPGENIRITSETEGTDITLYEIFPNVFIEATIVNTKGNYVTLNVPAGFYDYDTTKLAKRNQILKLKYM